MISWAGGAGDSPGFGAGVAFLAGAGFTFFAVAEGEASGFKREESEGESEPHRHPRHVCRKPAAFAIPVPARSPDPGWAWNDQRPQRKPNGWSPVSAGSVAL